MLRLSKRVIEERTVISEHSKVLFVNQVGFLATFDITAGEKNIIEITWSDNVAVVYFSESMIFLVTDIYFVREILGNSCHNETRLTVNKSQDFMQPTASSSSFVGFSFRLSVEVFRRRSFLLATLSTEANAWDSLAVKIRKISIHLFAIDSRRLFQ